MIDREGVGGGDRLEDRYRRRGGRSSVGLFCIRVGRV